MKKKKTALAVLLLALCLLLCGCRTRTNTGRQAGPEHEEGQAEGVSAPVSGSLPGGGDGDSAAQEQEKNEEPGDQTRENPEASRKEYDEDRPAEILPGTERTVHGSGDGDGSAASGADADRSVPKLNESAEKTATRTEAAEEAERKGVSEDAAEADSAMTYYTVLLQDRTGSLFECQRMYVYWETAVDHTTVFKTSPEHSLILDAGAYDVSARLLEGNLRVDDGWVVRKNPDVIVKAVDRSVLGTGTASADAARRVYGGLLSREGWSSVNAVRNKRVLVLSEELLEAPHLRLAAMLMIAKTANPDLFADVSADDALAMLAEEASGSAPGGIYYYNGQGGF